jgi:hypothetical protein
LGEKTTVEASGRSLSLAIILANQMGRKTTVEASGRSLSLNLIDCISICGIKPDPKGIRGQLAN